MRTPWPSPETIAERTPDDRDRLADLVRLGAILLVVLGHWLVGVVRVGDGAIEVDRLIALVPESQPLTWVFQVMPLFFLVGGAVNAGSWQRAEQQGEAWPVWLRRRARRLLGPLVPLLVLWLPLTAALRASDVPEGWVAAAVDNALLPVWFLAVYLLAIALVPVTLPLHRRYGVWVLVAAVVGTGIVDALHRAGTPMVGYVNYLLVWAGAHQVGYLWRDGRLPRGPRGGLPLAALGAGALALAFTVGGYPIALVAPGDGLPDSADPPTLAMWALLTAQLGLVTAARPALDRWLARPRVWAPVVLLGGVTMTIFLWHMTALIVVGALVLPTGIWPDLPQVDATWWALRPIWIALCAVVLVVLVAVFRRFEEVEDPVPREGRVRALVGLGATVLGLAMILTGGVFEPDRPGGLPLGWIGLFVAGLGALGVLRPARTMPSSGPG